MRTGVRWRARLGMSAALLVVTTALTVAPAGATQGHGQGRIPDPGNPLELLCKDGNGLLCFLTHILPGS